MRIEQLGNSIVKYEEFLGAVEIVSQKPNWYAAIRKREGGPWVCLLGPYATKREADAMHNTATSLVFDLCPVEEVRRPVFGTIKVRGDYNLPGKLMPYLSA